MKAVVEATEGETVVLWKMNGRRTGFSPPIGGRYWQVSGKRPRFRDLAGCFARKSLTEDITIVAVLVLQGSVPGISILKVENTTVDR